MAVFLRASYIGANFLAQSAKQKPIFKPLDCPTRNSFECHVRRRCSANLQNLRMLNTSLTRTEYADKELIKNILTFWYGNDAFPPFEIYERKKDLWYASSDEVDVDIRNRFGRETDEAISGNFDHWIGNKKHKFKSELALIILLDQFPRNIYRGSEKAFAGDKKTRSIIQHLLANGDWDELKHHFSPIARMSFLLPLMHQESLEDQGKCIELIQAMIEECKVAGKQAEETSKVLDKSLYFAQMHRDIIEQFGRFPHRNKALSRPSTPEEERYLVDGPKFGQ